MEQEIIASDEQVLGTLREVLAAFHVDGADVTPEASFEALGLDSLDIVELSVKVEDAYGIDIEEDDLKEVVTVGDAARLVVRKAAART